MSRKNPNQQNIVQQCEELRAKIQLLEGDKKAYYENSEYSIKKNREKVTKLRKENKELRKCLADKLAADEHVISEGLKDQPTEKNALKNKPGRVAISVMDQKCCDLIKKLNREKHETCKRQKKVEELQTQHDQMEKDSSDAAASDTGESEEAQKQRNLANRLDKANLKCKEAEHIQKTYLQIKAKLEEEHKTFETTLDDNEKEIKRLKQELKELKIMQNDAVLSRDAAKKELERQEKQVYGDKKKREIELQKMKKEAEEKRIQQERIDRRIAARGSIQQDELTPEQRQAILGEDDHQKITTYEQAFRKIKEATGVSKTTEVVTRFENQEETTEHLEDLKKDNEKQIARLREEKEKLQQEYEEMKYSGEAKLSSGQRLLEEFENHVEDEENRKKTNREKLDKYSKVLTDAKSGVEHLSKKLQPLKAPSSQVQKAKISPASDEYILDHLSICEEKLLKLMEELDASGKDVSDITKQMEDDEFQNTGFENRLPIYNTRVDIQTSTKDAVFDVDDDSGEDEDIPSRQGLKKQSQQIVDSKTRRRPGKRKKKKVPTATLR